MIHLRLDRLNAATGIPGLNRQVALETKIAMPPLPEQKKIAKILSTVDEAIEKSDEIIKKTKELKKGLMQELLTCGIGYKKFKKTKIGEIPMDWEVKKLKEIIKLINGRAFKPTEWSERGLPIVRIQNLNDPAKPFNCCNFDVPSRYIINSGALLLAWSGTPSTSFGIHKWKGDRAVLNQHIFKVVSTSHNLSTEYLVYTLNHKLDYLIRKAHGGVGLKHVTKDVVEQMLISVPSLPEQKKIAGILSTVDEDIEREVDNKKKLEIIKKGLMQVLLTGKVRIRI
ncbi:hypothetical protein ES703_73116 [subsurface metagenome]